MKKILFAAAASMAFASLAQAQNINVCVEGAYPPFSETASDGSVVGFDIDIANALAAEMGMTAKMIKTDWDGIIPALLERKCDAIIASMSITEDRMKVIDFSTKYYNSPGRFVAKDGATLDDLPGKTVGVQRGTIYQDFMEGEYPDNELKLYGSQDEVYLDMVAGRIDVMMADAIAMQDGFLNTDTGKGFSFFGPDYTEPKYFGVGAGIGVRKGEEELRNAFSHAIGRIRGSGEYQAINAKYFDIDIFGG